MKKRNSYRTITALGLLLAVVVVLACIVQHTNSRLPASNEARRAASQNTAIPNVSQGVAAAVLAMGTFAPPTAPALGLTMADFTGDTHPDLATVELEQLDPSSARYWIEIRLTEGGHQILKLRAPFGGLIVTARDVTGDGNLDLIVRSGRSRAVVALFLNDGSGRFSRVDVSAFTGILGDQSSQFAFAAQYDYVGVPLAYVESYTAKCSTVPLGYLPEQKGCFLLSNGQSAFQLSLSFGANRAPPSLV